MKHKRALLPQRTLNKPGLAKVMSDVTSNIFIHNFNVHTKKVQKHAKIGHCVGPITCVITCPKRRSLCHKVIESKQNNYTNGDV